MSEDSREQFRKMLEAMCRPAHSFDVHFEWKEVLGDRNGLPYEYPQRLLAAFKSEYSGPAVYRWRVKSAADGERDKVYIGETVSLAQRVQQVLNPGVSQLTNIRLKREFDKLVLSKRRITLETLSFDEFVFNTVWLSIRLLEDPFRRRLLENLSVLIALQTGDDVLNLGLDFLDRKFKAKFKRLPAKRKRELVRWAQQNVPAKHDGAATSGQSQ